jgi:shikimate kinase
VTERRPYEGHLFLVGLPGAGKSTCARLLASALGRPAIDLDEEIERRAGLAVAEIFARHGEPHFRSLEHAATVDLVEGPPAVFAPGGGWIENPENVAAARRAGRTVYLAVSPARALDRLAGGRERRPLLRGPSPAATIAELHARRHPLYARSDAVINTEDFNPQQVTEYLVDLALRWGSPIG